MRTGRRALLPALASPSPRTSATPVPTNVSARPDTIWSAWRWMHTKRMQGARARPGGHREDQAEPGVAGLDADLEPDRAPDEHHPLDTEVDDAGALG